MKRPKPEVNPTWAAGLLSCLLRFRRKLQAEDVLVGVDVVGDSTEVPGQVERDPLFIFRDRDADLRIEPRARCGFRAFTLGLGLVLQTHEPLEAVSVFGHGHVSEEEVDVFSVFGEHRHDPGAEARARGGLSLFVIDFVLGFHLIFLHFVLLF